MTLKQTVKKVEESKVFKGFIKKHPEYYLVHCFTMAESSARKYKWELGYYSEKKDMMVVFETEPKIGIRPEEQAFKKSGTIKRLDLGRVKLSVTKALNICDELVKDKYPRENITKKIILLQHLDKQVFNITLVSASFNILNVKIDADTGEILHDNIQSIMGLGKR